MAKLQFEATTSCNAQCTFCPRYDMTRPRGEMSDELFHKIIQESKGFNKPEIVPFLNGEPFLFPRIWEWLDYMRDNNCRVYLFTNAALMDVERLVGYKNIRYVCCSINATTQATYADIMRGPEYNVVESKVKRLIEQAPFRVYVSMVKVDRNKNEVDDFRNKWGKRAVFGEFKNWGGARHDAIEKTGVRKPCPSIQNTITILWDGRVAACCLDYDGRLILGDANKQTLPEIWNSYRWLRESHGKLDFSMVPCKECNQNI